MAIGGESACCDRTARLAPGVRTQEDIHDGELQIGNRQPHDRERWRRRGGRGEIACRARREPHDSYSANQGDFWKHLHNLAWYPEGTGVNQIDEPWNTARTAVTELDGRGSTSYAASYAANVVSVSLLRIDNCSPP